MGTTTLVLEIVKTMPCVYLDLENMQDPFVYFQMHMDKLLILDEIQRAPEIFSSMRSMIDADQRNDKKHGQYLIVGSASLD